MAESIFDPAYEFRAPKFFDFSILDGADQSGEGDSFFDRQQQSENSETFSMDEDTKGHLPEMMVLAPTTKQPASTTKKAVLGTAMRALRLGNNNGAIENKRIYLEGPKERKPLSQPLKSRLPVPSPTVGVKKCKPKSPTKPKTFSFQTDQRAQLPRKRELFGSGGSSRLGQASSQGSTTSLINGNKPIKKPSSTQGSTTSLNNGNKPTTKLSIKGSLERARRSLVKNSKKILHRAIISKSASQENVHDSKRPANQILANMVGGRSASAGDVSEKQPLFKARPAPPRAPGSLPSKQIRPPTQLQPFNLQTEKIGEQHKLKWCMKVDKEEKNRKEAALFHAQPLPNLNKVFHVKHAQRRTMGAPLVHLHTERRAEKRKAFDDATKKREEEVKEQMEKQEKEQRRINEEEIRNLRKKLVHHPKPIPIAKPIEVKRGAISTTVAVTPKFSTTDRLKIRMLRQQNNNPACKF